VQCSGNGVQTCSASGTWGSPVTCTNQTCINGVCSGVCAPGQTQCSGNATEACTASGTWGSPSSCTNQTCVNGACTGVCAPGQTNCSGNTPQTCSSTGTWTNQATCAQPKPTCQGGSCVCTQTICTSDNTCSGLNTTQDCSACGDKCNPTNATAASCSGTTCSYTCATGYFDCNKGTVPDTDGCECAGSGTGCCGTACQIAHSDGVGNAFYDCNALSTYNVTTALEACKAYAASIGGAATNCSDGYECGCPSACKPPPVVCYVDATTQACSYCWGYTSPTDQGWVEDCTCPESGSKVGTWQ